LEETQFRCCGARLEGAVAVLARELEGRVLPRTVSVASATIAAVEPATGRMYECAARVFAMDE
jgi:hypothetical protein